MFIVQLVIQAKILNQKHCVLISQKKPSQALELTSASYQSTLHEESHTIDLLSIQIDKYKRKLKCFFIFLISFCQLKVKINETIPIFKVKSWRTSQKIFLSGQVCFFHRYLVEVDCSLGQFKSAKLKYKEYTLNDARSSAKYCRTSTTILQNGNVYLFDMSKQYNFAFILVQSCQIKLGNDQHFRLMF